MRPPRHTAKATSLAAGLAAVVCAWFFFAPPALGGATSYVVTDGISMEPQFHAGDLALVRAESDYRVGQIVAYRNRQLGTIVLHRIVARDGSRYVFKGDNNNFLDFERPARDQLIGALWMHLPGVGADLASVRSPALIGALFAVGTLLLGGGAFARRRRRRRRERRGGGQAASPGPAVARTPGLYLVAATLALAALIPFAALALLAFTRPSGAVVSSKVAYHQQGRLSYGARPPAGPAYPAEGLHTGDPIFTHVVSTVEVGYSYRFASAARHSVSGTASLSAELGSTSGWKTTIPLGAPEPFRGDTAHVSARLDVSSVLALVSRVQAITGVHGSYTLAIVPRVKVTGTAGGAPLKEVFDPPSRFSLNQLEIRPLTATGSAAETSNPSSLFAKSEAGTATTRSGQAARLSLGAFALPVALAREIALGGIALVACALAVALAVAPRRRRGGETAEILSRYGYLIVPVERVWQMPGVAVIDVADIDALARIAARYERSILHERAEYGDAFWVSDESGQFRYAVWDPAPEAAGWVEAEAAGWEQAGEEGAAEDCWQGQTAGNAPTQFDVAGADPVRWGGDPAPTAEKDAPPAGDEPTASDAPAPIEQARPGLSSETLRYGTVSPAVVAPS